MLEKIFAATIVIGCLVLMLRLIVGPDRRARLDAMLARIARRTGATADAVFAWPGARRRARREAEAAIRRAREAGEWQGNVYRPKSFKGKKRDLH